MSLLLLVMGTFVAGIETLLLRRGAAIYFALALLAYRYGSKVRARRHLWQRTRVAFEDVPEGFMKLGVAPE